MGGQEWDPVDGMCQMVNTILLVVNKILSQFRTFNPPIDQIRVAVAVQKSENVASSQTIRWELNCEWKKPHSLFRSK